MPRIYRIWLKIWPTIFYGLFVSLLAFLILSDVFRGVNYVPHEITELEVEILMIPPELEPLLIEVLNFDNPFVFHEQDLILAAYEDPINHDWIESFFELITGCRNIAEVILANAVEHSIPPSLAFSLCWEESRYNPRAVNRSNSNRTIDRGLFQLNSASFPNLKEQDFFDIRINTKHGLSYLRWCLDTAGTEVAGLAMYNAGFGKVRTGGTPQVTLDYISRIINRQRRIDEIFFEEYARTRPLLDEYLIDEHANSMIAEVPDLIVSDFSLSLTPLGRR